VPLWLNSFSSAKGGELTNKNKNYIWVEITQNVNAMGYGQKRTTEQVKFRWKNLKARATLRIVTALSSKPILTLCEGLRAVAPTQWPIDPLVMSSKQTKGLGEDHVAAAQMFSTAMPSSTAGDMATLRVEWALTTKGEANPCWVYAKLIA